MGETVIRAEGLGKKYIISHRQGGGSYNYIALRDVIAGWGKRIGKSLIQPFPRKPCAVGTSEEFWALKDLSFEITGGDRLGIIGRNGAGKSTLLKILSRIVEPTRGRVIIKGRVGSLLEVGTGFHPELTGRENIFLNGAILGMKKSEIRRRFDEIVAFAEVERFLDTPIKRYSSGMYVRLAFSVAAHLHPEILIVDEVLAVGDVQFQKKCLGKMEEVGQGGRTVLFVSHNMAVVEQLCNCCMLLEAGQITEFAYEPRRIIKRYLSAQGNELTATEWVNSGNEFMNDWFSPERFYMGDQFGTKLENPIANNADAWLYVEGTVGRVSNYLALAYAVCSDEVMVYQSATHDISPLFAAQIRPGPQCFKTKLPKQFLNEGDYRIELAVFIHGQFYICEFRKGCPHINVSIRGGLSGSPHWNNRREGVMAPVLEWQVI